MKQNYPGKVKLLSHHASTVKVCRFRPNEIHHSRFRHSTNLVILCVNVRIILSEFLHRKLIAITYSMNYDLGKNILLQMFSILFIENSKGLHSAELLRKGQEIKVIGTSSKRGFLIAQIGSGTMHVPFQLTELKTVRVHITYLNLVCHTKTNRF